MLPMTYQLYYWPMIPGRGEFVRLVLEEAGAPYVDVGREQGIDAILKVREEGLGGLPPYAPPVLVDGALVLWQTAVICQYLGEKHGLAPAEDDDRLRAAALMHTLMDIVMEVHDVHHPVSTLLAYEEQSEVSAHAARTFTEMRLAGWIGYLGRLLDASTGPAVFGEVPTYPDIAIDQLLRGLDYAFPKAMGRLSETEKHGPALAALRALQQLVGTRPRIEAYRRSERCIPFSLHGVFRHYPELDVAPRSRKG